MAAVTGPERPRQAAAPSWATWPHQQPQAGQAEPVNPAIPRFCYYLATSLHVGPRLRTTEWLIIRESVARIHLLASWASSTPHSLEKSRLKGYHGIYSNTNLVFIVILIICCARKVK
ncbi:hypothetical protein TURU_013075 [Turdus rufiventris]|nr:hypothetical protein TURU_013075 [Turdus rufiventris]